MGKKRRWANLIFVLPMFLAIALFSYVPTIIAVPGSFHVQLLNHSRWGFDNYILVLQDHEFWWSMSNTIVLMAMGLAMGIPAALIIAVLINNLARAKSLFKIGFFLPNLTSIVIVIIVMKTVFSSGDAGFANKMLDLFGIPSVEWLSDPRISKVTVVLMGLWHGIGYTTLLYLAGLQVISGHLYESAGIDGASAWQKFVYITIPGVRNTTLFLLVTGIISGFQRFQDVFVLSGNGWSIDKNLQTVMMYIYKYNFTNAGGVKPGVSLAGGVILAVVIFIIIAILSKFTKVTQSARMS